MQSILTVTTPAHTYDLTVLATVKRELGITNADSDTLLTDHIRQCSNAVMSYTGRVFALETLTELFWHEGYCRHTLRGAPIVLSRYPVATITSATLDDVVVDTSLYRIDNTSGRLFKLDSSGYPCSWYFGKGLSIVYNAGYALLADLPFDIERATILWIKEAYFGAGENVRDPQVKSEQSYNVATFSYFDRASGGGSPRPPPEVEQLLNPYRQPLIG